jgi:hypothetical protein
MSENVTEVTGSGQGQDRTCWPPRLAALLALTIARNKCARNSSRRASSEMGT